MVATEPNNKLKERKMFAITPAEMTMACCNGGRFWRRSLSSYLKEGGRGGGGGEKVLLDYLRTERESGKHKKMKENKRKKPSSTDRETKAYLINSPSASCS